MLNSNFLFLLFLIGCATANKPAVAPEKPVENHALLKQNCEQNADKFACARFGYLTKEIAYTKEACRLGDDNSCFNVREIENRAPNQNLSIINSHQGMIYGCYVNNSIDLDNGENAKKDKDIYLIFNIDTFGKITSLDVQGKNLSDKFKKCVIDSFTSKRFVALDHHQAIRYAMILPEVTRDRRVKQTGQGLMD